jgi:hypothetical protein
VREIQSFTRIVKEEMPGSKPNPSPTPDGEPESNHPSNAKSFN